MQGHRVKALTVFIALLALVGCKDRSQPQTPVAVAPAPVVPSRQHHDSSTATILLKGTDPESRQVIVPDMDVTFRYDAPDSVVHFKDDSPCTVSGDLPLNLEDPPTDKDEPYVAQCKVKPDVSPGTSFPYRIKGAHIPVTGSGHCKGCVLETQPQ